MRTRCLLPLSLIIAAAVLRTQSFSPILRSVRRHTPEVLDQKLVESLRSNIPSVLEVALHSFSLPNYLILTFLTRNIDSLMGKAFPRSFRNKTNKVEKTAKYQNIKYTSVYKRHNIKYTSVYKTPNIKFY